MTELDDRLGPGARGDGEPDVTCAAPTCRRAPARGLLCTTDADQLGQWLADFADDWRRLDSTPTMASPSAGRVSGGGLASHGAPAKLDVIVLRDPRSRARDEDDPDGNRGRSLAEVISSWAGTVREERGMELTSTRVTMPLGGRPAGPLCEDWCAHESCDAWTLRAYVTPPPSVSADRLLLVTHLGWILGREWVGDFYVEVRDVWAQLKAVTGESAGARPVRACPTLVGTPAVRCNGPVWLEKGAAWCGHCATAWSGFQLVRLLREAAA